MHEQGDKEEGAQEVRPDVGCCCCQDAPGQVSGRDEVRTSLIVYSEQALHGSRVGKGRPSVVRVRSISPLPTQHDLPVASHDEFVVPWEVSSTVPNRDVPSVGFSPLPWD